jgi:hypothetical protein
VFLFKTGIADVFIMFFTMVLLSFMCSHSRLTPAAPKMQEKKEQKLDFDYFDIYQLTPVTIPYVPQHINKYQTV